MIEKTKRSTVESGYFLISLGFFSALATLTIGLLELFHFQSYVMPVIILMALVNAFIGYFIVARESKNENVTTYSKILFWNIWMVCGFSALIIVFVLPFLNLYSFKAVPVLISLIMGIGLYVTGVILELRFIQWFSLVWWSGAILMAIIDTPYRFILMAVIILLGWVVPGLLLNRQYKFRGAQ